MFQIGHHWGNEVDGDNTLISERTLHSDLTLTLSDSSTVTTGDNIKSFTAYTENDAKVAESLLDNDRYNTEIMRAVIVGEPGAEWYTLSNFVDSSNGNLIGGGIGQMDDFNAGNYSFDNLKKMIDEKYKASVAINAYHHKGRAESRSYAHTVTHSISVTVSSGVLTIPAMEVVSSVYNYDNIAGYWGVTAGGADLRNWANIGDISVRVNGLELDENAVSYSLADKAGVINGTYDSNSGVSSNARPMYGGTNGELAVQITSIIIDVDKVGYEIDSDDVIEIIYDKRRGKAVSEGYSPDAEVTECGDATASNYVPNAFAYNNSLCQYSFPSFSIAPSDDIAFRVVLPYTSINGIYNSATNYEGSGSQQYSYYQNGFGDLSIEIGTVAGSSLTALGTFPFPTPNLGPIVSALNKFPGDVELSQMMVYDDLGNKIQGLTPGRHYIKVTGALSNNPHYAKPLMVEMYKNTGQSGYALDIDVADKYFSFGGVSSLVEVQVDGVYSNAAFLNDQNVSEKSYFPDGIIELGKIYYFTVA